MINEQLFLGHTTQYWIELQKKLKTNHGFKASDLLDEIAQLRGQIAFTKDRLNQINQVIY